MSSSIAQERSDRGGGPAADPRRTRTVVGLAIAVGLAAGALTAWAQSWLPEQAASLANSVGSWSLIAFVLALLAPTARSAALTGALVLAALLAGYVVTDALRAHPSGSALIVFWGLAAVIGGPLLGVAAHWTRHAATLAGVGAGVMSGVLIGEGVYGLHYLADTTYLPYWWGQIGVGAVLTVAAAALRAWRGRTIAVAALSALGVAVVFVVLYHLAGGVIGSL